MSINKNGSKFGLWYESRFFRDMVFVFITFCRRRECCRLWVVSRSLARYPVCQDQDIIFLPLSFPPVHPLFFPPPPPPPPLPCYHLPARTKTGRIGDLWWVSQRYNFIFSSRVDSILMQIRILEPPWVIGIPIQFMNTSLRLLFFSNDFFSCYLLDIFLNLINCSNLGFKSCFHSIWSIFCTLDLHIADLDPDPGSLNVADPTDSDTKHCLVVHLSHSHSNNSLKVMNLKVLSETW